MQENKLTTLIVTLAAPSQFYKLKSNFFKPKRIFVFPAHNHRLPFLMHPNINNFNNGEIIIQIILNIYSYFPEKLYFNYFCYIVIFYVIKRNVIKN